VDLTRKYSKILKTNTYILTTCITGTLYTLAIIIEVYVKHTILLSLIYKLYLKYENAFLIVAFLFAVRTRLFQVAKWAAIKHNGSNKDVNLPRVNGDVTRNNPDISVIHIPGEYAF